MEDGKLLKGVICFVMALIVWGGCAAAFLLCPPTMQKDAGAVCSVIAILIGGGLAAAGVKFFGINFWNNWD